jgi:hypothetical protein
MWLIAWNKMCGRPTDEALSPLPAPDPAGGPSGLAETAYDEVFSVMLLAPIGGSDMEWLDHA